MAMIGILAATVTLNVALPDGRDLALLARKAADAAVAKYADKKLKAEQLGLTVIALDRVRREYVSGSFRGDQAMYPASVVKLLYLAYAAQQLEERKIKLTPELERGIKDMIVDSSNDATALVLDTITETTGGPELSPKELQRWMERRRAVNRWFGSLGYPPLNANQKTWNEGPYGRERQGYGPNFEYRNSFSSDTAARLMAEIALDRIVSPAQCEFMRKYLSRTIPAEGKADYQSASFTGKVLPKGSRLWSKAGYTSTVRHDVAYVRAIDGREFVIAVFTQGQSDNTDLVPFLARELLTGLGALG